MKSRWLLSLSILAVGLLPGLIHAQFTPLDPGIEVTVSPTIPEPNTTVTARLNTSGLAEPIDTISWFVDGETVPDSRNQRAITVPVGAIGIDIEVTAQLRLANGQLLFADTVVTPSRLTLILEPQTTVPRWYKGRALPTVGSQVRAFALPDTGSGLPASAYTYTWRINNAVLGGAGQRGAREQTFTVPMGRQAILSLDVQNPQGQIVAQRSVVIPTTEPELHFYTVNPLRGQERLTIPDTTTIIGSELTVRGEPYYLSQNTAPRDMLYEWSVDGLTIDNPSSDPLSLTMQHGGGIGFFRVELHARNLDNLVQGTRGQFNVQF
jgi:hypothetical protein